MRKVMLSLTNLEGGDEIFDGLLIYRISVDPEGDTEIHLSQDGRVIDSVFVKEDPTVVLERLADGAREMGGQVVDIRHPEDCPIP